MPISLLSRSRSHLWLRRERALLCLLAGITVVAVPSLVSSFLSFRSVPGELERPVDRDGTQGRSLLSSSGTTCDSSFDRNGGIVLYILGTLYMFLGLAIICDEYFVASLEKISEALSLSDDVAGATFMAVGSSAPELFTSLADVFFMESGVGIGTIVGSAMFNLLVIVGTTAVYVFVKGRQKIILDWWPLARDVSFYVGSILMLLWVYWDNSVEWWESLIFLAGYIVYVLFMKFNTTLGNAMRNACACCPRPENSGDVNAVESDEDAEVANSVTDGSSAEFGDASVSRKADAGSSSAHAMEVYDVEETPTDSGDLEETRVKRPRRLDGEDVGEGSATASSSGRGAVRASSTVALRPDRSKKGEKDKKEVRRRSCANPVRVDDILNGNEDTVMNVASLFPWHRRVDPEEKRKRTGKVGPLQDPHGPALTMGVLARIAIIREKFVEIVRRRRRREDADAELDITIPSGFVGKLLFFVSVPLIFLFRYTVIDCRRSRFLKWYSATFLISVMWIGAMSYVMVDLASRIGCILGIHPVLMGLVVLAAGTSVPDLLSSLAVAKEGQGDMALSNAVGSNVFDILVGLGLPWLIKTAILLGGNPMSVESGDVLLSVILLFGSVIVFVLTFVVLRWRLKLGAGILFLAMYVAFVVFSILSAVL